MKSKSGKIPSLCYVAGPLLGMCLRNKASLFLLAATSQSHSGMTLFFLYILYKTWTRKVRLRTIHSRNSLKQW